MNDAKKISQYLNFSILIITLIVVLIGSCFITYSRITTLDYSYFLIGIGAVAFFSYIITKILDFKFSKFEIGFFITAVFSILSLFGAIKLENAIWGADYRNEGLLVFLTYYFLSLIAYQIRNKKHKKIIIGCILFIAACNFIYGLVQTDWLPSMKSWIIEGKWYYAKGFNGNSMYYGSLMSLCYPIVIGLFVKEIDLKKSVLLALVVLAFTFATILSGSMAVYVACITVFVYLFFRCGIQLIKTKSKEHLVEFLKVLGCIVVFIVCSKVIAIKTSALSMDIKEMKEQAIQISTTAKADDSFGTGRIFIWRNVIEKIKENYIFGVGIDNVGIAFDNKLIDTKSGGIVNKAHNEYLQKILTEGVLSGIFSICFISWICLKNIKNEEKMYYCLFLGLLCYCIQAFFGISITRVSPILYIIIGLLMGKENEQENIKIKD